MQRVNHLIRRATVHPIRHRASKSALIKAALLSIVLVSHASAQAGSHLIVVKMVDRANGHFAFDPSVIAAQRGDTVRFVQASTVPHDIHFESTPKGAKLGDATTSPYLIGDTKNFDLVVDSRFVDGTYKFVCDPHESVGMTGTLTVSTPSK